MKDWNALDWGLAAMLVIVAGLGLVIIFGLWHPPDGLVEFIQGDRK